jgi:hypothetical protein
MSVPMGVSMEDRRTRAPLAAARPPAKRSEFLGLHDPYRDLPGAEASVPRPKEPLMTREKAHELLRAGASLTVLVVVMAVAIVAFH